MSRGQHIEPGSSMTANECRWWQSTTIYQIYPRSYADSNGDGIGDLPGIVEHLDHIADLGIETVWVSPFFASPQVDFGYDITDYCDVAPEYGTLADAQRLIDECHRRGLRVIFDLVPNHTSDQHPWFLESRSSRDNPKVDWYHWLDSRPGRNGRRRKPNNWRAIVPWKSGWQWSPEREQWYLATFLPCQPDLNWHHPDVKAAMFDVMRFWLSRGVDGFRIDMFGYVGKDAQYRPDPFRPHVHAGMPRLWRRDNTENTPDAFRLAGELRAVADEFSEPERVLLAEVFGPLPTLRSYIGDGDGLHLTFLFQFLTYRYRADWLRRCIEAFERAFPPPHLPTYVIENHDRSRTIDRLGGNLDKARVLATVLLTVRGVPTIYMGQEIGMSNTHIPLWQAQDPLAKQYFRWLPEAISKRLPERVNRDEVRTPMQWDRSPNSDFCPSDVTPWLPVNPGHGSVNVADQSDDPSSMLSLYRELLALRRARPALHAGTLSMLDSQPDVLAYERSGDDDTVVVYANLGAQPARVRLDEAAALVLTSGTGVTLTDRWLHLPSNRAALVDLP